MADFGGKVALHYPRHSHTMTLSYAAHFRDTKLSIEKEKGVDLMR